MIHCNKDLVVLGIMSEKVYYLKIPCVALIDTFMKGEFCVVVIRLTPLTLKFLTDSPPLQFLSHLAYMHKIISLSTHLTAVADMTLIIIHSIDFNLVS